MKAKILSTLIVSLFFVGFSAQAQFKMPSAKDIKKKAEKQAQEKAQNEAVKYCREVRDKLATMCRNSKELKNNNKVKITKLIKRITCRLGKGEGTASYKIQNGELQAFLGPKASNISENLLAFLDSTPE